MMSVIETRWFWLTITLLAITGVIAGMVFTEKLEATTALAFLATNVVSVLVGMSVPKKR